MHPSSTSSVFLPRSGSGPTIRDIPGAKPPSADAPAPTEQSSFSELGTAQSLVFGISATLLAVLALYFSYRQLRTMRAQHITRAASSINSTHGETELMRLRDATTEHQPRGFEPPSLSARILTFQQYVTTRCCCRALPSPLLAVS